ncbi:hypothetical protein BHE74_00034418 [Ensete ventricosum]|nr:hypothetical protein BHE74_00034418 [Ensete ventricosum]RZS20339.1 hypothetical protein BHM03_00052843 [Ensete ventricosum]
MHERNRMNLYYLQFGWYLLLSSQQSKESAPAILGWSGLRSFTDRPTSLAMGLLHVLSILAGLASLGLLSSLELKKWNRRQLMAEKLRRVSEALEQAEERLTRFQERHDKILFQINSHYLCHAEMEEALSGGQKATNEALQFCADLRRMQMNIITLYPPGGLHDACTPRDT